MTKRTAVTIEIRVVKYSTQSGGHGIDGYISGTRIHQERSPTAESREGQKYTTRTDKANVEIFVCTIT